MHLPLPAASARSLRTIRNKSSLPTHMALRGAHTPPAPDPSNTLWLCWGFGLSCMLQSLFIVSFDKVCAMLLRCRLLVMKRPSLLGVVCLEFVVHTWCVRFAMLSAVHQVGTSSHLSIYVSLMCAWLGGNVPGTWRSVEMLAGSHSLSYPYTDVRVS